MSDYGTRLMTGFTKLFSTIVHSTVWREEMHVKVVWVTMLVLANRNGVVEASVPGLADAARVSLDQCEDALRRLAAPDRYSRTKDHEGRRIEAIDGGWRILNYLKYRERQDDDARRIATAARVRRFREKRESVTVTPGNAIAEAEAEAEAEERTTDSVAVAPVASSWTREACDDWITAYQGTAPGGRIGKALKPLVARHGWSPVREAWRSYLGQTEAEYASPQRFAATYGRWSGGGGPGPPSKAAAVQAGNRAVLEAFVKGGRP